MVRLVSARTPFPLGRYLNSTPLMSMMFIVCLMIVAGCSRQSSVCATEPPNLPIELRQGLDVRHDTGMSGPMEVRIRNQSVSVDQIVHGPLCDVHWSGTIYIDCDVSVPAWDRDEKPTFFEGCNLNIEDNTVVYVAYHNDEAYYTGCSCHLEE